MQEILNRNPEAADPREIVSGRLIAAPRETVFKAFADPTHLARWWGPSGFANTFEEFDFRPGGTWRFTMHGPDGRDYLNRSVFLEIQESARIVLEHESAPAFRMTITLANENGNTRLGWRMLFDSAALRDQLAPICVPANEQNFDRLQAELVRMN